MPKIDLGVLRHFCMRVCCSLSKTLAIRMDDKVGKQNSNGRVDENKIEVEFIIIYMSVWLLLWSMWLVEMDMRSHYGLPICDDVHIAVLKVVDIIHVNPVV